jgi:flagellar basal-body rod modification protein FlgD
MISTSRATKAWGGPQQSSFKSDDVHYEAAKPDVAPDAAGSQGGSGGTGSVQGGDKENIGEILNRIADPTGTEAAKAASRKPSNQLNKDDFLKLMLAQMKNQDPMNPMQSHEMAAQLAQFTSLEQLFNVNQNLEGLKKQQDPSIKFQALNFLGKSVKADSKQILKDEGAQPQDLKFDLADGAQQVTVRISDEVGNDVQTMQLPGLKKGVNTITWNGLDSEGRPTKGGRYFASFEAVGHNGKKIGVETATNGVITGVNYTKEGPVLLVGTQRVRLQDVQEIVDDNMTGAAPQKQVPTTLMPGQGPVMVPGLQSQPQAQQGTAVPEVNTQGAATTQSKTPPSQTIDQGQLTKVSKEAQKKNASHYNAKASLPLEVEGGGIKSDGPFKTVAKGG